ATSVAVERPFIFRAVAHLDVSNAECRRQINRCKSAVSQEQSQMNECPVQASTPVTAAVIGELQNKPGPPENSNARRQPAAERIRRARDLPGKTPGHRREDEERRSEEHTSELQSP